MEQEIQPLEQYKNDALTVTVHRKPKCMVEFQVHVSPKFTQSNYEKAVKLVLKEVSIPGFRKGKAPREMVVKKFTREIDREWQNELSNAAFVEAEKLANIPVLRKDAKINFNVKHYSTDKGAEVNFTFETEPTIPPVDPKLFKISSVERPKVSEKEVNETMRQVRYFFSDWKPITDRPVQEGDFVLLDVDVLEDEKFERLFSGTRFEVSDYSMAKWMKGLVIGHKEGDTVEGVSTADDDANEKDKAEFKPKKVSITIKKIEQALMPELDEKYYKGLGVENEEQMRTNVTKLLNEKADEHVREAERTQAVDFLLHQHPFDLPPSFVMNETRFRLRQLSEDPYFNKQWTSMSEEQQKTALQSIMEQSEKAVRLFYLCNRVLKDAHIKISPDDLPKPPSTALEVLIKPQSDFHSQENEKLREAEAYSRLILEKAEDYIISKAREA